MSGQLFLKSTPLKEIRESGILGRPLHSIYTQLQITIGERRDKNLALLLAEPVMQTDEGCIDWYTSGEQCQPLKELPQELQHQAKTILHDNYLELEALAKELADSQEEGDRQVGAALTAALVVPADENIYWVDDQPVLALWGCYQSEGDLVTWHNSFFANNKEKRAAAQPQEMAGEAVVETPPSVSTSTTGPMLGKYVVIGSRFFWSVFFFSLLALLLALIFSQCTQDTHSTAVTTSPVSGVAEQLDQARKTEQELRKKISGLLEEVEDKRADCPENNEVVESTTGEKEKQEFDKRIERENASVGEITVTLKWNNRNDLDLYVHCPMGDKIYFRNPRGCRGTLDVDNNYRGELTKSPVENINWQKGEAVEGVYQVSVKYHKRQDMEVTPVTQYQVRLRKGDQDSLFEGRLGPNQWQTVTSFTVSR